MANKGHGWYEAWARDVKKDIEGRCRIRFPRHWRKVFRVAYRKENLRRMSVVKVLDFGGILVDQMVDQRLNEITPSQLALFASKSAQYQVWLRQDESAE
jgi:hypothetical protein